MKKIFFLLAVIGLFALPAFSQAPTVSRMDTVTAGTDSVITNAGTGQLRYTLTTNYHKAVIVQLLLTENGSVTSAGTCICQGSLDPLMGWDTLMTTKFTPIAGATFNSTLTSVYTIRDAATQTHQWEIANPPKYIRVFCTGSGTMSSYMRARIQPVRYER